MKMRNTGTDQKRNSGPNESANRDCKCKSACPAFGRILLWQPKRIHREIGAAKSQERQTRNEGRERMRWQVKRIAKSQRDKHQHHCKVQRKRCPAAKPFRKGR